MIEVQPTLDIPLGEIALWHFMTLEKYVSVLTSLRNWRSGQLRRSAFRRARAAGTSITRRPL